jgi:competence protein ComEA
MDQAAVAALTLSALLAIAAYWFAHGGRGGMIEIDRQPERSVQFLVDINEADWPELAQLPGIGPTLARRIVDTRTARGPFADHAQLRRVSGIGPKTLERIRPYLLPMPDGGNVAGK